VKLLFMDFETSGLLKPSPVPLNKQPHAIEYYGCIVDSETLEIESDFDTLIKPPVPITKEITKITGIKQEDVVESPSFASVAKHIEEQLSICDRMVAHNATYDGEIMRIEFERLGKSTEIPKLICTVEQSCHILGYRLKLNDLHEHLFGERFSGSHRAKEDVRALLRCYRELVRRGEI